MATFEERVAEGLSVPVEGWDFSWFDGRATEERPPWGYAGLLGAADGAAPPAALDVETGGGEVLAGVARRPRAPGRDRILAAERRRRPPAVCARSGAMSSQPPTLPRCPSSSCSFDLVVSRHPVVVLWDEIARVLRPGGTYLSQQIGAGTNRELTEFMMGPQPVNQRRSPGCCPRAAPRPRASR